jgi:thiol:disulfide interchange protein DsbD
MNIKRHWMPAFAGMTLVLSTAVFAGTDPFGKKKPEFLPVDAAFELQPLVSRGGTLEISWRIAENYYLYRDKLKITTTAPGLKLDKPVLPASIPYEDEHFGTVQVYRTKLVVLVPYTGDLRPGETVKVVYQGCADAGLCYPPQTRTLESGS